MMEREFQKAPATPPAAAGPFSRPLRLMSVVGARPNFVKIAPFIRQVSRHPGALAHFLVHTGQHYDEAMSSAFFAELKIPPPDVDLGIGSGTHAEQVGRTMIEFEKVVQAWKPDWIIVAGDVNATCAAAITAKKERVHLAHIEAGLRSFDSFMPEEINRIITDRLSDLLFTTDEIAGQNLRREGVPEAAIRQVGNIMIDTLESNRETASQLTVAGIVSSRLAPGGRKPSDQLLEAGFALITLHRPSNVDAQESLQRLVELFCRRIAPQLPVIWSLHPRTLKQLESFALWDRLAACPSMILLQPVGYREMLKLNMSASIMLTDSGGLQEECCVLGTPCLTLRENTERPVTLRRHGGTCELAGHDPVRILQLFEDLRPWARRPSRPALWDGHTAGRIVDAFIPIAIHPA